MAHKKGQGSSRNGRDSKPQKRGIKAYGGQWVPAGSIIVRQVGTQFHPGRHVGLAKDFSIFAMVDGIVKFESRRRISIEPEAVDVEVPAAKAAGVAPKKS